MGLIVDHAVNRLAKSLIDYFYDNVQKTHSTSASSLSHEPQMLAALNGLRDIFQSEKRPLEVMLQLPEQLGSSTQACLKHIEEYYPMEELVMCKTRLRRYMDRIESLLEHHDQLTQEGIRTLRTARILSQYTAGFIALFLLYLYVKRFHGHVFQSEMYQTLTDRKIVLGGFLTAAAISIYVFVDHRKCLDQLRGFIR